MKYWLCITNMENWDVILDKEVHGFNERNKRYFELLSIGDKVAMYITPKRIGGLFEIVKIDFSKEVIFGGGDYPYRIKLKKIKLPSQFILMDERLTDNISIFKGAIKWGATLMGKSIREITKNDFELISKIINEQK